MYYCKCPFVTEKWFIVVHNTGMPSPARNEISYMIRNTNEVSFHDAVDEKEIVHGIPHSRNVWGSGEGRGDGNMHGIQIEICRSTHEDESLFAKAEENAAEYIAHLLRLYDWGFDPSRIKKHQDFDGKYCPHKTLDWGWTRFLDRVKYYYDKADEQEEEEVTYEQWKEFQQRYESEVASYDVEAWGKEAWDKVTEAGIMDGKRPASFISRQEFAVVLDRLDKMAE